jgi:hypothetical protein
MSTVRTVLFSVLAGPALALAQSSNIDLFSFVMQDAQLIAGAHVDSAKNSPFGQYVLSQIPMGEKYLQGFETETGINPLSDVTEVLAAWNGAPNANGHWVIGAHGAFTQSIPAIEVNVLKNGGSITRLAGVDLITMGQAGMNSKEANVCIGLFTDGLTDLIGDCTSVTAAIQFGVATSGPGTSLVLTAQQLRAHQDLWFASVVPLSEFSGLLPGSASGSGSPLSGVLKSKLLLAIQQISGGVKFPTAAEGSGAQFSAEVLLDSPQDATSLLNVLNFVVGLVQMNTGSAPAAAGFASLLGGLQTSVSGSTLNVGLNVPESTLEQLFQQVSQLAMNHVDLNLAK